MTNDEIKLRLLRSFPRDPLVEIVSHGTYRYATDISHLFAANKPDWQGLREHWEAAREKRGITDRKAIYIHPETELEWREIILALDHPEKDLANSSDNITLHASRLDSFTAQAQRKDIVKTPYLETHIARITKSSDGKFLFGIRGHFDHVGDVIMAPAGAVSFAVAGPDKIKSGLYKEAHEEIALCPGDFASVRLVGLYNAPIGSSAASHVFVYAVQLQIEAAEVIERHRKSLDIYNKALTSSESSDEVERILHARRTLEEAAGSDQTIAVDA